MSGKIDMTADMVSVTAGVKAIAFGESSVVDSSRVITYSKSIKGADGSGSDSRIITLKPQAKAFTKRDDASYSPAYIKIDYSAENLSGKTFTWTATKEDGTTNIPLNPNSGSGLYLWDHPTDNNTSTDLIDVTQSSATTAYIRADDTTNLDFDAQGGNIILTITEDMQQLL